MKQHVLQIFVTRIDLQWEIEIKLLTMIKHWAIVILQSILIFKVCHKICGTDAKAIYRAKIFEHII